MIVEKNQMVKEGNTRINGGGTFAGPNKLLLTFDQASDALMLSQGMLRKLARTGRLRVVKIGRSARIPQSEILRLSGGQPIGGVQ